MVTRRHAIAGPRRPWWVRDLVRMAAVSTSRMFADRIDHDLAALDELIDGVEAELARLGGAAPIAADEFARAAAQVATASSELAAVVKAAAEEHGLEASWRDRVELLAL